MASSMVYIGMGSSSLAWSAFNVLSLLGVIMWVIYDSTLHKFFTLWEKTFAKLCIILTGLRVIYTFICIYSLDNWVYKSNIWFVLIFLAIFIAMIFNRSRNVI